MNSYFVQNISVTSKNRKKPKMGKTKMKKQKQPCQIHMNSQTYASNIAVSCFYYYLSGFIIARACLKKDALAAIRLYFLLPRSGSAAYSLYSHMQGQHSIICCLFLPYSHHISDIFSLQVSART